MSLKQSFIFHLISLVLGACTSLGNHLGEYVSSLIQWRIRKDRSPHFCWCLTILVLGKSNLKRISDSWVWHLFLSSLQKLFRILLHAKITLPSSAQGQESSWGPSQRTFFLVMKWWDNDRKTEHLRGSSWLMELLWKFRLVSWTKLKL